jgi:hypothetical protein
MYARLEKLFGDWKYQQMPVPPFPAVHEKPEPGVFVAKKDDVTQTFFIEGHLGGELKDKDFPALEVTADILGGGFQSRLMQSVRTRLGLAYAISADWGAHYDHPGLFQIGGSTKSESTAETLKAIQEEVNRLRSAEVSEDELETARQAALNSLVFAFDTKAKTLGRLLNYEYFGYPKDFIDRYQRGLEAVTRADVLRVSEQHIHPNDMTIVAVGRADEFEKSVATLGLPVSSIDLTIPPPKTVASKKKTDAASAQKALDLLHRAQQAAGGADKLAAITDMIEVAELHLDPSAGRALVKRIDEWLAPSYFREDSQLPFGSLSIYSDGKTGWMSSPRGVGPMPPEPLKQVRGRLLRIYPRLLLSDRAKDRTVSLLDDNTLEIADSQGESVRVSFDSKTGLPTKLEYSGAQISGPPTTVDETLDSFEEVDGLKVPNHITITQNGQKYGTLEVQEVKFNTGLKPENMSKKPESGK